MNSTFSKGEKTFPELPVMYITTTVPHEEMRQTRMYFMKLGLYAFSKRAKPTGDVFIRYIDETPDTITMEICFGVEKLLPETKDIKSKILPKTSGHYAICTHVGPREELIDAYVSFAQWFQKEQLERSGGPLIEYYGNDPRKTPKQDLITELYWPIEK